MSRFTDVKHVLQVFCHIEGIRVSSQGTSQRAGLYVTDFDNITAQVALTSAATKTVVDLLQKHT